MGWSGKDLDSCRLRLYFDHFGEGITNTFDRQGSFGLTTAEVNPAAIQTVDGSARYSGLFNIPTSSALGPLIGAPPTGPFPVYPPSGAATPGGFAITWGLDDKLKTPYSHVIDFSITRELPSNFVFEASYVLRMAHRLMQEEDLAEPTNLRDPVGGQTYFQAAQALARQYKTGGANATDISQITPALVGTLLAAPFSGSCGSSFNADFQDRASQPATGLTTVTATQAMYDLFELLCRKRNLGPRNRRRSWYSPGRAADSMLSRLRHHQRSSDHGLRFLLAAILFFGRLAEHREQQLQRRPVQPAA